MDLNVLKKIEININDLTMRLNGIASNDPPSLHQVNVADRDYETLKQELLDVEKQRHNLTLEFEQRFSSIKESLEVCKNILEEVKSRT